MTALILLSEWEKSQIEFWKRIAGYPGYDVSSFGRVRSYWVKRLRKGRIGFYSEIDAVPHLRKLNLKEDGYLWIGLPQKHKRTRKTFYVNRLVATAFLPNPENKVQVNHKTGVQGDNRVDNLEWNTRSENINHAYRHGLKVAPSGDEWLSARSHLTLTPDKVREIRRRVAAGEMQKDVAKDFNVRPGAICRVMSGQRWGHVS